MNEKKFEDNNLSRFNTAFLEMAAQRRMNELQLNSLKAYHSFRDANESERKKFLTSLQISYSEFFRNGLTFAVLERIVLPQIVLKCLKSGRREIRLWSAACAGGQEAYSLAILLEEIKEKRNNDFSYRIFGTDLDVRQIECAKKGEYAYADIQNISMKRASRWFSERGGVYSALPELQEFINFTVFDLMNESMAAPPNSIFGDFNLVLCANVLFYYNNQYREIILKKLQNGLGIDGVLVTSESERDIVMNYGYREVYPQSAVFRTRVDGRKNEI